MTFEEWFEDNAYDLMDLPANADDIDDVARAAWVRSAMPSYEAPCPR